MIWLYIILRTCRLPLSPDHPLALRGLTPLCGFRFFARSHNEVYYVRKKNIDNELSPFGVVVTCINVIGSYVRRCTLHRFVLIVYCIVTPSILNSILNECSRPIYAHDFFKVVFISLSGRFTRDNACVRVCVCVCVCSNTCRHRHNSHYYGYCRL